MGRGERSEKATEQGPALRSAANPPPELDDGEERFEAVCVSIWIRPLDEQRAEVQVEIDAEGYDAPLLQHHDIEIPTDLDAAGPLSAEILRGLITRETVREIAKQLQVPYERQ